MIVLTISLTLNLFLLGMAAGFLASKPNHEFHSMRGSFKYPPHDMSPQMRQAMKSKHKQLQENRRSVNQLKRKLYDLLQQEILDIGEVRQALKEIKQLREASATLSQEATISAIENMSLEERVDFSQNLFKKKRRGPQD